MTWIARRLGPAYDTLLGLWAFWCAFHGQYAQACFILLLLVYANQRKAEEQ